MLAEQIDLLSYTLTPAELEPDPASESKHKALPVKSNCNKSAIDWQYTKASVYLKLMGALMRSQRISADARQHEIERLHSMRQLALEQARSLENG